jgi:predicted HTH domain antitoxin
MIVALDTVTPQMVLDLTQTFSTREINWLITQLKQLVENELLPENATLDEAIELFLADKCSLGRAAELVGVTRWDIQQELASRGISIEIYSNQSVEDMDLLEEELERRGLLCSL